MESATSLPDIIIAMLFGSSKPDAELASTCFFSEILLTDDR
jgi:hypothetical protein